VMQGPSPEAARRHLEAAAGFHTEAMQPLVKLVELDRRLGRVTEEKRHLHKALTIDGDSFDPAARLLMLAVVTDDKDAFAFALRRARAIAPLHPITLAARALEAKKDPARATERAARAAQILSDAGGQGPADSYVVAALAAASTGNAASARELARRALRDESLPEAAKKKLEGL